MNSINRELKRTYNYTMVKMERNITRLEERIRESKDLIEQDTEDIIKLKNELSNYKRFGHK